MARRYTLTYSYPLNGQIDADNPAIETMIDIPQLLSQRLQRNVRQGKVFHLHKVQANLTGATADLDTGLSVSGQIQHCPATKNSAKAWRHAFAVWRKQKMLKVGAAGPLVRYDDFEIGWTDSLKSSRTSTIYATGMNDLTSESVVIYGTSTEGADLTLEDLYESLQGQPEPSRFPLDNSTVKQSKFVDEFPNPVITPFTATHTAMTVLASGGTFEAGAMSSGEATYVSDTATLCGVLRLVGYVLPEANAEHTTDTLTLNVSLTVSMGMPLAKVPKRGKGFRMSQSRRWPAKKAKAYKRQAWRTYYRRK